MGYMVCSLLINVLYAHVGQNPKISRFSRRKLNRDKSFQLESILAARQSSFLTSRPICMTYFSSSASGV